MGSWNYLQLQFSSGFELLIIQYEHVCGDLKAGSIPNLSQVLCWLAAGKSNPGAAISKWSLPLQEGLLGGQELVPLRTMVVVLEFPPMFDLPVTLKHLPHPDESHPSPPRVGETAAEP